MATIIKTKKCGSKVHSEIVSEYDEYLQLHGNMEKVYLFSEKCATIQTNISQRGKNSATKYFLIPKQLRRGFRCNNAISCQRLDLGDRIIFIYVLDKTQTIPSRREQYINRMIEKDLSKMEKYNETNSVC